MNEWMYDAREGHQAHSLDVLARVRVFHADGSPMKHVLAADPVKGVLRFKSDPHLDLDGKPTGESIIERHILSECKCDPELRLQRSSVCFPLEIVTGGVRIELVPEK